MQNNIHKGVIIFICILCASCGVNVATKTGRIKSIVESYFRGNGQTMYFIKPIAFRNDDDEHLTMDFTLTIPDSLQQVKSNFSLFTDASAKAIDSLILITDEKSTVSKNPVLMFKDHSKKKKQIRYTHTFPQSDFAAIVKQPNLQIKIYQSGAEKTFTIPEKKWKKIAARVDQVVFTE